MYARKIAQIAESRRHLRRDSGSLTYRRPKRKLRKAVVKREASFSRRRPLFLVFMFLVTQYFFLHSPLFQLREVTIEGEKRVTDKVIESKLAFNHDTSYWGTSAAVLEDNLSSLHGLQKATVALSFPGRVEVIVKERVPSFYASFRGKAGTWYSVDSEGVTLEAEEAPKGSLQFMLPYPIKNGTRIRPSEMRVVRFLQDHLLDDLKKRVRLVKLADNGLISFRVSFGANPIWVRLGRPEKLQYKLFLLNELIQQLGKEKDNINSVDLRYSAPVVEMKVQAKPDEEHEFEPQ